MGITNIGKTTQMRLLEKALQEKGLSFKTLKYPVYNHKPTGPRIWDFLKEGNPENLLPLKFQELCADNRRDFEPELESLLKENRVVIAEMYTGTGIAYGMGDDLEKKTLLDINQGLLVPDVSILLDGKRYMESVESSHRYETDDEKTEKIRLIHLDLANELNWTVLDANETEQEVHSKIMAIIESNFEKPQADA